MKSQIRIPTCRKCNIPGDEVPEFIEKADVHNADGNPLRISPSTWAFGPGSHFDPSSFTFICPSCKEEE